MNVLIVEDEKRLADSLSEILKEHKIASDVVYDGQDGYDYASSSIYDLILLDIMLPKMDGFSVVRKLRDNKIQTPVLLLTARDEVSDKVKGLDSGADDYLTKPFSTEELLARVRAMTRRKGEVMLDELTFGDLTLNLAAYTLSCQEKSIKLGFKEFEILRLLMASPSVIIGKEELLTKVWGYLSDAEDNNVEVYISFIRKKLQFVGSRVLITTVRKIGYHLEYSDDQKTQN